MFEDMNCRNFLKMLLHDNSAPDLCNWKSDTYCVK